jgi:hypothetical protein
MSHDRLPGQGPMTVGGDPGGPGHLGEALTCILADTVSFFQYIVPGFTYVGLPSDKKTPKRWQPLRSLRHGEAMRRYGRY